ncbi:MAG: PTS sugar transporter subunit IIA [Planctomycetota bacterium]|jgi:mannitol/fructose-specific phosphotransferase system IIA component (Ntr-type)
MSLAGHLKAENVFTDLEGTDKNGVLKEMVGRIQENGGLTTHMARKALDAILEREARGSTGIGNGVGIPHVKMKNGPAEPLVAIGRCDAGIDFASVDGEPVHVLFLLITNEAASETHLEILKGITTLIRDGYRHRLLLGSRTPEDFIDLFDEV